MKAEELTKERDGKLCSCGEYEYYENALLFMKMGRCLPINAHQARYWVKNELSVGRLNRDDVDVIEAMLRQHGMEGDYVEDKHWIFLVNQADLRSAIKIKFKL